MHGPADSIADCWWHRQRMRRTVIEPLRGDTRVDIAVIGGGYTGLSTAWRLAEADPALDVAVLEAQEVGQGASGRNGGFVMTLFGASVGLVHGLYGKARLREAHEFMERAVEAIATTVETHALDCDFHRTGFLRVATSERWARRLDQERALLESAGIHAMQPLSRHELTRRVNSPTFLAGCFEQGCGSLHPLKWLDGLDFLARGAGVRVLERSPVTRVRRESGRYRLTTPNGTLSADKVVYATNGYTHSLPGWRLSQVPAFAYVVVTEPLSAEQRAEIGWQAREGIEDGRNFMHFYRLLPDGRLLAGGGPGLVPFAGRMDRTASEKAWRHLQRFIGDTFPCLRDIPMAHRWGGAFSVTMDQIPRVGALDGGGAVAVFGCTGHGVGHTHLFGEIVRDLVLGRKTELTDLWFVNRRSLPFPPEPLRWGGTKAVMQAMAIDDWWCDRG